LVGYEDFDELGRALRNLDKAFKVLLEVRIWNDLVFL
jgi:hypothetical protein